MEISPSILPRALQATLTQDAALTQVRRSEARTVEALITAVSDQSPTKSGKAGGYQLELNVDGERVEVTSRQAFAVGTRLLIRALTPARIRVEQLISEPLAERDTLLRTALRQALPQQIPLRQAVQHLQQAGQDSALPVVIRERIQALLSVLPQSEQLLAPAGLRDAMQRSGIFLEARLQQAPLPASGNPDSPKLSPSIPSLPNNVPAPPPAPGTQPPRGAQEATAPEVAVRTQPSIGARPAIEAGRSPGSAQPTDAAPATDTAKTVPTPGMPAPLRPSAPLPARGSSPEALAPATAQASTVAADPVARKGAPTTSVEGSAAKQATSTANVDNRTIRAESPAAEAIPSPRTYRRQGDEASSSARTLSEQPKESPNASGLGSISPRGVEADGPVVRRTLDGMLALLGVRRSTADASPRPQSTAEAAPAPATPSTAPPRHAGTYDARGHINPQTRAFSGNGVPAPVQPTRSEPALTQNTSPAQRSPATPSQAQTAAMASALVKAAQPTGAPSRVSATAKDTIPNTDIGGGSASASRPGPLPNADPSLQGDMKARLLDLLALLRTLFPPRPATPQAFTATPGRGAPPTLPLYDAQGSLRQGSYDGSTRGTIPHPHAEHSAQQQMDQASVDILRRHLEGAVARTQVHQMASLPETRQPADAAPVATWTMEIPMARGRELDMLELRIEDHGNSEEGKQVERVWRIMMSLDIDTLGPLHALLQLTGARLAASLWAEHPDTLRSMRAAIDGLEQILTAEGVEVTRLECLPGRPEPMRPRPFEQLLDIRT